MMSIFRQGSTSLSKFISATGTASITSVLGNVNTPFGLRGQTANFIVPSSEKKIIPIYRAYPSLINKGENIVKVTEQKYVDKFDPNNIRRDLIRRNSQNRINVGDIVRVTNKDNSSFTGMCLAIRRAGLGSTVLLRNQIKKMGIDMRFSIFNPKHIKVEIVRKSAKKYKTEKIYYVKGIKGDVKSDLSNVGRQRR
ncbi:hypothetical protein NADFUDRAFT_46971 [Nadsonia fulvescens var. elongata DSM 6958]|uniref:Ribosomal protein L19 n=1 Tax=Nadsonia fulvescens var. elongata DSM 6958 TaxID=857566 RepID=A0A1E3PJZ2_9ASCO|nr:hypothetical protein NADFUDRAFT_46971 [Nadsonia fulvescens var. elongata DSM 6958]